MAHDRFSNFGQSVSRWLCAMGLTHHGYLRIEQQVIGSRLAGCEPLRVVFASDFHAGPTTPESVLVDACAKLRTVDPQVLLLGGDYVSYSMSGLDGLIRQLSEVPAPLGRYAVLGDHDLRINPTRITAKLESAGIQVLKNQSVQLPEPYQDFWICGLDPTASESAMAEQMFRGATGTRIVLTHSPAAMKAVQHHSFRVLFCGHTHGGQIAAPGGKPIYLPKGSLCRRFPAGRFELGDDADRTLIVSRGIGCSLVPIRAFAPPDIVVCHFQHEASQKDPGTPVSASATISGRRF